MITMQGLKSHPLACYIYDDIYGMIYDFWRKKRKRDLPDMKTIFGHGEAQVLVKKK